MNCYVTNPFEKSVLPSELDKGNTLFYPEAGMTTMQMLTTGRPKDFHVVTDCPFFPSLYDRKEVFIWRGGKWANPRIQTYAASYNIILSDVFGYESSIPAACLSGGITNIMGYKL